MARWKVGITLVAACLLIGSPALASASNGAAAPQGADAVGEISGSVRDPDGAPLPGVTATLEGEGLIQERVTTVSNANGVFRFRNIRPGAYMLTLSLTGFRTVEYQAQAKVGSATTVVVGLQLAGVQEAVMVVSEMPLIDIKKAQISNSFAEELIQNIPLAREFTVVADLTPGITDRGAYGAGGNIENRYRQGSSTTAYRMNGVDITEPDWGATWVNPSIDTIAEVQVVGIGASAQYGNFTGATVNLITKGGTNVFHGAVSYYYENDSLRGDNANGVPEYTRGVFDYSHDMSLSLGGPIVPRKLLFFSSFGYRKRSRLPFADPSVDDDPRREKTTRHRYHGRLDWMLSDSTTLGFMFNSDPSTDRGLGQDPGAGPEIGYGVDFGSKSWLASVQSQLGDNTYLDFRYSGYRGDYLEEPITCCDITPIFDYSTDIQHGTSGFVLDEDNGRHEIDVSITHYADNFLGASHDLKIGAEYEDTWSLFLGAYTGTGGIGIYSYYGYTYVYGYTYSAHLDMAVKRFAAYIQDDIQIGDRLNLNLGLRFDNPTIDDVYEGPVDPTYFGPAPRKLADFKNLAPRLGATFDLTGQAKYVAHASWGRYHEKALSFGPSNTGAAYEAFDFFINVVDTPWNPDNIDFAFWESIAFLPENLEFTYSGPGPAYAIDPDLRQQKTDVFNVGMQVQLSNDWVIGVDYIHKRDDDMMITTDLAQHTYEPFEFTDSLGSTQTLYMRTDDNEEDWILTNDDYYFRKHDMVILSLEKRPSANFSFNTSLTWQKSIGNIENTVGAAWGFGAVASNVNNPNFDGHPYTVGRLTYDREWQFKLVANYRLPGGILAGAYYRYQSGRPWTPRIRKFRIPVDMDQPNIFSLRLEPRGSRRADALNQLDVRLQKTLNIGDNRLELILDGFNITQSDTPTRIYTFINQKFPISGGSAFGKPSRIIAPRQLRLGIRFIF